MSAELAAIGSCAACKAPLAWDRAFCHFFENEERVALCCPACAENFLTPSPRATAERTEGAVIEQLVAEWRWRKFGD
ncbi:MAG: hypothetical protein ABIZ49_10065 [Opitutaceae bacterium]